MKIVLIGAGGSGISNIAHLLYDLGYENLLAIDAAESQLTQALQKKGISVLIGHGNYQIKPDDLVIYSEATVNSPEVISALELKKTQQQPLKIRNYFQFLGEMSKYFRTIGFAGTNGKSSSTALAIFTAQKLIPELWIGIVGALVPDFDNKSYYLNPTKKAEFRQLFDAIFMGKNLPYHFIKKRYFFVESCEYKRHFLNLDLEKLLITNIELDHTDYFQDIQDYTLAYEQMIAKTHDEVFVLENLESEKIKSDSKTTIVPIQSRKLKHIRGNHTDQNASLVAALMYQLVPDLPNESIQQAMEDFRWIWRRMEFLTTLPSGTQLYSDYGHIASSLRIGYQMLKQKYPDHQITAIFQPHQMQRVLRGWEDFKPALAHFDQLAIFAIYAAREKIEDIANEPIFAQQELKSVADLGRYFAQENNAFYLDTLQEVKDFLAQRGENEIVVIFTAGELDFQVRKILNLLP